MKKTCSANAFKRWLASLALIFIFSAVWAQPVEQLKLRPPLGPLPPSFWELHRAQFIGGGIAIFLLVCLGILCLLRPKRAVKLPPAIIARRGLEKLMRQPEDGKVLSEASRILKIFILAEFNLPPEELTTQEFGAALKKIAPLNPAIAEQTSGFLRRCDAAKFAPATPVNSGRMVPEALELLEKIIAQRLAIEPREKPPTVASR
jgi:hypothetical protein